MTIVVNEDLRAYIDPLTPEEYEALERSLLAEGCRDALVLWGEVLVDGHNRHRICTKHGLPFETVQNPRFRSIDDVHLWMIDQHLGRRSVSDFQRGVLALRKKEIVAGRAATSTEGGPDAPFDGGVAVVPSAPIASRDALARAARLSSSQIVMIEKIRKHAAPEVFEAVRSGSISINAAAAVASLPAEAQSAAAAGGRDELRQAARQVRDAKRKPREPVTASSDAAPEPRDADADDIVAGLRRRVRELEAENDGLRREIEAMRA